MNGTPQERYVLVHGAGDKIYHLTKDNSLQFAGCKM